MILKLWKLLEGYKTYIGVGIYFILGGLFALNTIDQKTFEVLISLNTAWTGFAMRKAIQ